VSVFCCEAAAFCILPDNGFRLVERWWRITLLYLPYKHRYSASSEPIKTLEPTYRRDKYQGKEKKRKEKEKERKKSKKKEKCFDGLPEGNKRVSREKERKGRKKLEKRGRISFLFFFWN